MHSNVPANFEESLKEHSWLEMRTVPHIWHECTDTVRDDDSMGWAAAAAAAVAAAAVAAATATVVFQERIPLSPG